jgi:hypothetical protein
VIEFEDRAIGEQVFENGSGQRIIKSREGRCLSRLVDFAVIPMFARAVLGHLLDGLRRPVEFSVVSSRKPPGLRLTRAQRTSV